MKEFTIHTNFGLKVGEVYDDSDYVLFLLTAVHKTDLKDEYGEPLCVFEWDELPTSQWILRLRSSYVKERAKSMVPENVTKHYNGLIKFLKEEGVKLLRAV